MVNCWVFDGVDDYLSAPTSATIESPTGGLTLWAWWKPSGVQSANWSAVIHKNWVTGGGSPYQSYSMSNHNNLPANMVGAVSDGAINRATPTGGYPLTVGAWHFAVTNYNGAQLRFRVWDAAGTLLTDTTRNLTGVIGYSTGDLRICRSEGGSVAGGKMAYAGAHNAVWDDTQLATLRTTGVPPVTPSAWFLPLQTSTPTDTAQDNTFTVFGASLDTTDGPPVTPPGGVTGPFLRTAGGFLRTASGILRPA